MNNDKYSDFSFESLKRLLLGHEYFYEIVLPVLRKKFPEFEKDVIALDLGSASFGASDNDSDFDGMVVLNDTIWKEIGQDLSQKLSSLPSWRCNDKKIRFFVGRYSNFGFSNFFIDHSPKKWYEIPLSAHWHFQHYYRYYDPKRDFYRFQEEISKIPAQYLRHRSAGHFFQLYNHMERMENAILQEEDISFYVNLGETFFHSLCLPFFMNKETTPLWRWLFTILLKSENITISKITKKLENISTSVCPNNAVDLFKEYQNEIANLYHDLDLLPPEWLTTPSQIPLEHQNPQLHPNFPSKTSKSGGNVETEQRRQLWASWFKFSSLVFWFSKIIKRRDFCAAYIAIGRTLDNAITITNIFSDQVGKDIMEYVVKSTTEMKKTREWQRRQELLTLLQKKIAKRLRKTKSIPLRYIENPIALMAEDLDLGL